MSSTVPAPGSAAADAQPRRLSARAVPYWRLHLAAQGLPAAAVATVVLALVPVPGWVAAVGTAAAWVAALGTVAVVPAVRRRIWWYAIGAEEVDLHHGLLVITRTVVPMVRVQHVDLHHGPLADRFGLAEIELHTAAGSVTIPALDRDEAEALRAHIAALARVPDEL
ncbi:PH domain-containing protein [Patulibacter sp. SYSU D01012]|uniref:PH domain-containing protein n=1 Tax=Patulibacter sp. SYSU D01012 TaxID=2817381 RepID=UPI001B313B47|nr:PH domain-containing protein [Patulibacter sp. SYSU D01012]